MLKTLKRKLTLKFLWSKKAKSQQTNSSSQPPLSTTRVEEQLLIGSFLLRQDELFISDHIFSWLNIKEAKSLSMTCTLFRHIFCEYYPVHLMCCSERFYRLQQFKNIKAIDIQVETIKDFEPFILTTTDESTSCFNLLNLKHLKIVFHTNSEIIADKIGSVIHSVYQQTTLDRLVLDNRIKYSSEVSSKIGRSIYDNIPKSSLRKLITNLPTNLSEPSLTCPHLQLGSQFHVMDNTSVDFQNLKWFKCTLQSNNMFEFQKIYTNQMFNPKSIDLDLDCSVSSRLPQLIQLLISSQNICHIRLSGEADGKSIFHELLQCTIPNTLSLSIQDPNPHRLSSFELFRHFNRVKQASILITYNEIQALLDLLSQQGHTRSQKLLIVCDNDTTLTDLSIAFSKFSNPLPLVYLVKKRHIDISDRSSRVGRKYCNGIKLFEKNSLLLSKRDLLHLENIPSLVLY